MSEEEAEGLDAIVVGFEDEYCVVSPTKNLTPEEMQRLVGRAVFYEDFRGVVWQGRILELREDTFLVMFEGAALSDGGPSGLGQGSLVRIP